MSIELRPGELFFKAKPARAIIALGNEKREWYASSLAKEIDCTFPHIIKVLSAFQKAGLVSFKPKGRKKIILLTSRGKQISAGFAELISAVGK